MNIINQDIKETKKIINTQNQELAKEQYNKLVSKYKSIIDDFEDGTRELQARKNIVWNANGLNLPTDSDYIADLEKLVEKLEIYKQISKLK